eukprot:maker-scaffold1762_size28832-snap-gene-0.5 protein:Tk09883 transcript:maker-scaffold1762_size28832-snap-gene-0.5-mRNA-1 annotation:"fad-containing monooxygenase"
MLNLGPSGWTVLFFFISSPLGVALQAAAKRPDTFNRNSDEARNEKIVNLFPDRGIKASSNPWDQFIQNARADVEPKLGNDPPKAPAGGYEFGSLSQGLVN